MAKVTVTTPINHDGVLYEPGDVLECSNAQAKNLCGLGSAKMAGKAAEPDETETTETTGKSTKGNGKKVR